MRTTVFAVRGFVREEALPVFTGWGVIGDTACDASHSGDRVSGRQGEEVCVRLVADTWLEPFAFTFNSEPLSTSVFLRCGLRLPPGIHVLDVVVEDRKSVV